MPDASPLLGFSATPGSCQIKGSQGVRANINVDIKVTETDMEWGMGWGGLQVWEEEDGGRVCSQAEDSPMPGEIMRKQMNKAVWHLSSACPPKHELRGEAAW